MIEFAATYILFAILTMLASAAGLHMAGSKIKYETILISGALWPLTLWHAVFGTFEDKK